MTDYITQNIKFHQEISDEIFEDIYYIINDKINEFGLTLANPIRRHYNIIEYDILLNDDADTIGNCITQISNHISKLCMDLSSIEKFLKDNKITDEEKIRRAYIEGMKPIPLDGIMMYHGLISE